MSLELLKKMGQAVTGTVQRIECAVNIVPFYLSCLAVFGTGQEEAVRGMVSKWVEMEIDLMRNWNVDPVEIAELRCVIFSMGIVRAEQIETAMHELRRTLVRKLRHEVLVLERLRGLKYGVCAIKEE